MLWCKCIKKICYFMNWPIRCLQFKTMVATLFAFYITTTKFQGSSRNLGVKCKPCNRCQIDEAITRGIAIQNIALEIPFSHALLYNNT